MSSTNRPSPPPSASTAPPVSSSSVSSSSLPRQSKRSSRLQSQRAVISSRPVLDAATRAHVNAVRLASLEADNHVEDVSLDDAWEDEEEQVQQGGAGAKAKGQGKGKGQGSGKRRRDAEAAGAVGAKGFGGKKQRRSLDEVLAEVGLREEGTAGPNYLTAAAGPCSHPPRRFCSVCGYSSSYTCARCGQRYCSIPCQKTHQDTRCSRG